MNMNETDITRREIVIKLNGQIVFAKYVESNSRECPERYFEEWLAQVSFKLSEEEQKGIWKIFINSLICWR